MSAELSVGRQWLADWNLGQKTKGNINQLKLRKNGMSLTALTQIHFKFLIKSFKGVNLKLTKIVVNAL